MWRTALHPGQSWTICFPAHSDRCVIFLFGYHQHYYCYSGIIFIRFLAQEPLQVLQHMHVHPRPWNNVATRMCCICFSCFAITMIFFNLACLSSCCAPDIKQFPLDSHYDYKGKMFLFMNHLLKHFRHKWHQRHIHVYLRFLLLSHPHS